MHILVVDRNSEMSEETRHFAHRRLLFALSRFENRIERVTLTVTDDNGPRGGVDKVVQVVVKLPKLADVIVNWREEILAASIAHAAERAGRAVSRALERHRAGHRDGRYSSQSAIPPFPSDN